MENQKEFKAQSPDTDLQVIDRRHTASAMVQINDEGITPMQIMMQAVKGGMGKEQLEVIERMFEFDLRVKAQQAKEAFYEAKAAFKSEVPRVIKDKENKQYGSMYASEDALFNTVNPILSRHGLEASFSYPKHEDPKMFVVRCTLSHKLGHSEFMDADGPLDTSGSKNPLQQYKSTRTYLKKESYAAITGIASADTVDDDGNLSGKSEDFITEKQVKEIEGMLSVIYGKDPSLFFSFLEGKYGITAVAEISTKNHKSILGGLKSALKKSREPGSDDA